MMSPMSPIWMLCKGPLRGFGFPAHIVNVSVSLPWSTGSQLVGEAISVTKLWYNPSPPMAIVLWSYLYSSSQNAIRGFLLWACGHIFARLHQVRLKFTINSLPRTTSRTLFTSLWSPVLFFSLLSSTLVLAVVLAHSSSVFGAGLARLMWRSRDPDRSTGVMSAASWQDCIIPSALPCSNEMHIRTARTRHL